MYYNPFLSILMRLAGQAAAGQFAQQRTVGGQGTGGTPFDDMFGGAGAAEQADDEPISVEAEVVDEDGKTQKQRAHEAWDAKRSTTTGAGALGGAVSFAGSKNYSILASVISALLFLGGIVYRVYSLVMGCIFSSVVVPVALGAIAGVIMGLAGAAAMWKFKHDKVPFFGIDLVLVFCSCTLMGWGLLLPAVVAGLACFAAKRLNKQGKFLPFLIPYAVVAVLQFVLLGFPGLCR